jgi:integrase
MPRKVPPLTDIKIKNAKPKAKPYRLSDGDGMYLEVQPSGSRYWRLKYRFAGKEKLLALGVYPTVTLTKAREKRGDARAQLDDGIDPAVTKRSDTRRKNLEASNTFELVAREWQLKMAPTWTPRYGANLLKRLEADIFPQFGSRAITSITAPDVLDALRKIEKRGALEIARRAGQTCGQVFRYAIATGRAERNPVPDLKDSLKSAQPSHFAAFDVDELPAFLKKLEKNDARLYTLTQQALRLLMLTFVRTGELIDAKWSEFDLDGAQWVIPAARMKMRKAHIVPLSTQAVALLREIREGNERKMVFPNQADPTKGMSNNTILGALGRMGYKGRMTGHGFRSLAMSTIKERLGYRHEVVDRQLAHAPKSKVAAAYDRAQFLDERVVMMQQWADYLDALAAGGKVVPIGKGKRAA